MDEILGIATEIMPIFSKVSRELFYLEKKLNVITSSTCEALLIPMRKMSTDERGQYLEGLYAILTEELSEDEYLERAKVFLEQMGK